MFKSHASTMAERYEGTPQAVNPAVDASAIQGWLLLLLVNLFFGTLINFLGMFTTADTFGRVICFIAAVTAGPAAYLLMQKDKRGVRLAKWHFGFLIVCYALAIYGSQTEHGFDDSAIKSVGYLLKSMVWFAYLFVSKRVKAVYFPASL